MRGVRGVLVHFVVVCLLGGVSSDGVVSERGNEEEREPLNLTAPHLDPLFRSRLHIHISNKCSRVSAATVALKNQTPQIAKNAPTFIGLATIPLIIHPIGACFSPSLLVLPHNGTSMNNWNTKRAAVVVVVVVVVGDDGDIDTNNVL